MSCHVRVCHELQDIPGSWNMTVWSRFIRWSSTMYRPLRVLYESTQQLPIDSLEQLEWSLFHQRFQTKPTCCFPVSWRLNVSISQGIWIFSSLRARWWQSSTLCRSTGAGCSSADWNDESGEVGWWAQSSDSADCPQTILFSQKLLVFWILKTENLKR